MFFFSVTCTLTSSIVCTEITITHIKIIEQQKMLLTKCDCIKLPLMLNLILVHVTANYYFITPSCRRRCQSGTPGRSKPCYMMEEVDREDLMWVPRRIGEAAARDMTHRLLRHAVEHAHTLQRHQNRAKSN